jgi:two-component system, OmpR family, response regulator VanR
MAAKLRGGRSPAHNGALTTLERVRVLLAEDERRVADAVARGLRREGMAVDVAYDGATALDKARLTPYDVVVLDRDLPEMHGDDVCRTLRKEEPDSRVLMLTAANGVDDLVDGLSLGADDYMPKPFAFAELVARVRALARRSGAALPPTLRSSDVELDPARHTVTRAGRPIELTPKEFAVLEALLAADGAVVSNDELVERVWDENADPFTNSVRMTVLRLRRKLGAPPLVETVKGAGYRV